MRFLPPNACALLVALALSGPMCAQPAPEAVPTKTDETLKTLAALGTIPDVKWRFHAGDLAHGEAVDLDDSAWAPAEKGVDMGVGAVWVRTAVEIPASINGYDPTGARIWLNSRFNSAPVEQIIYFNGRRVALGEDLEPIVLTESAKPGDKHIIAIKLLRSIEKKSLVRGEFRVEAVSSRPSPADLREEAVTARTLLGVTPGFRPEMMAEVEAAVAAVDLASLSTGDQTAFDASLVRAHEQLLKFRPMLQQVSFAMAGNSHIDAAWRWTESETIDVVRRTYGTAVQMMSEYPDYCFTQSAAQYNEWLELKFPVVENEIKRRVEEGRWEIVGGMWVEPDLNMPDGESLVRQLLVGKRYFKKEFGVDVRIGWNPDSFGYSWQLPQIYKKCGIDYFVTQKMRWNETNQLPLKLFWWESPDGSKVLTYFPTSYGNGNLRPSRQANNFLDQAERVPGANEGLDLYGVGDHGGGPTRIVLDEGNRWTRPDAVAPRTRFTTAQDFFSSVEKTIAPDSRTWNYTSIAKGWETPQPVGGKVSVPTWKDELYLETHRGTYTTQANHKRNMRESEQAILDAEKYASLAWLAGREYPTAEFEASWKRILFSQFHDLAAGAGIGQIYKDAAVDYKHVFQQIDGANRASLQAILATADTRVKGGVPIAIVNPLAWTRSEVVEVEVQMPKATDSIHIEDAKGRSVLSQVVEHKPETNTFRVLVRVPEAPSLGYTILRALPGSRKVTSDLRVDGLKLENELLKVVVDSKTGNITSLVQKQTNFESIAPGGVGNQLQTFVDTPKRFDAWNIDMEALDSYTALDEATSVKLVENGPLRATIRVERTWQQSRFTQDIILQAGADHVEFNNTVDWREEHVLLKVGFQLAATSPKATFEIPYGTIDRPTTRENSFDKAKFEVPAIRWADLGDGKHGLALVNRTKYGYDAVGNMLRLSLLRSPSFPDPVADRGVHQISYTVYPHAGDWKKALAMRRGYEFNYPLRAMQTNPHPGADGATRSFVSVDAENVVLTAVKKAEDADALVFRLFDWAGKGGTVKLRVPKGPASASFTDLLEQPRADQLIVREDTVEVPVKPYEIVTVQVKYDAQ